MSQTSDRTFWKPWWVTELSYINNVIKEQDVKCHDKLVHYKKELLFLLVELGRNKLDEQD